MNPSLIKSYYDYRKNETFKQAILDKNNVRDVKELQDKGTKTDNFVHGIASQRSSNAVSNASAQKAKQPSLNDKTIGKIKQGLEHVKGDVHSPLVAHHVSSIVKTAPGKVAHVGLSCLAATFKGDPQHSSPIAQMIGSFFDKLSQSNMGSGTNAQMEKDKMKRHAQEMSAKGQQAYDKHISGVKARNF